MSMHLFIHAESEFLSVSVTGKFSSKAAEANFLQIMEACARHKAKKIVIDGRDVKGSPDTIQRFLYGKFVAQAVAHYTRSHGVRHFLQFAYVLHEPLLDPRRFGETVAVNRGMWVKAFDNLLEAIAWLTLQRADSAIGHAD